MYRHPETSPNTDGGVLRRTLIAVVLAGLALLLVGPRLVSLASAPGDRELALQTPTTVSTTATTLAATPSMSFELSPGHLVRQHTRIDATITAENLDPNSYSGIVFRADITPYEDAETRCNGEDTGRDVAVEVDEASEEFTVNVFRACPHRSSGTYTLDLQVFRPGNRANPLASATTNFAFSRRLRPGEPVLDPPNATTPIWLDPDPADLVVDGLWHRFRIRSDVTQYLPGRVTIRPVVTSDPISDPGFGTPLPRPDSPLRLDPFQSYPGSTTGVCDRDEPLYPSFTAAIHSYVWLTACDAGDAAVGLFHDSLGAEALHTHTFTAEARPTNAAPAFREGTYAIRQVPENVSQGTSVGAKIAAGDSDSGDTLTYSLGGTDASSFRISTSSGQLRTHASLNYEAKRSYSVEVSVSDGKNASGGTDTSVDDTISVGVLVIDRPPFYVKFAARPVSDGRTTIGAGDSIDLSVTAADGTSPQDRVVTLRTAPGHGVEGVDYRIEPNSLTFGSTTEEATAVFTLLSSRLTGRRITVQALFDGKVVHADSVAVSGGGGGSVTSGGGGGGSGGGGGGSGGVGGGEADELDDVAPPSASEVFTDVPAGSWFESAVNWMILHDITRGCTATLFCPDAELTRQQFVTLLWRVAGQPAPVSLGSEVFSDVPEGVFSDRAIGWAVANDVTRGCTAGTIGDPDWNFCPTQPVTRGQMSALLYRHTEADYVGQNVAYRDVEAGDFYAEAVSWLTDFEVVPGCDAGLFCPDRNATRAEAAVFINGVAIRPHIWGEGNTALIPQPN